jgi:DNA-binding GntR family transcriptional regulator
MNTLKSFHNYIGKARETSFGSGGRALASANEHMRILEAIKNGDGGLAESLTKEHIKNAKANLLDSIKKNKRER